MLNEKHKRRNTKEHYVSTKHRLLTALPVACQNDQFTLHRVSLYKFSRILKIPHNMDNKGRLFMECITVKTANTRS